MPLVGLRTSLRSIGAERRLGYGSAMGTDGANVSSDGLALPEEEQARVASDFFAIVELHDPEHSAERSLAWARTVEERIERFAHGQSQGIDLDAARQRVDTALADN